MGRIHEPPIKKCPDCKRVLQWRMIQRAQATTDADSTIFAKSAPVAICPKCDHGDTKHSFKLPPPLSSP
jgi:hypothetical protein